MPQGVLAYRLLKSAALTSEQEQLAKAIVGTFTFDAMCSKLKSIFRNVNKINLTEGTAIQMSDIKQEETFMIEEEDALYGYTPWRPFEARGRGGRGAGRGRGPFGNRIERNDRQGSVACRNAMPVMETIG